MNMAAAKVRIKTVGTQFMSLANIKRRTMDIFQYNYCSLAK
jgi:hypothetical protein